MSVMFNFFIDANPLTNCQLYIQISLHPETGNKVLLIIMVTVNQFLWISLFMVNPKSKLYLGWKVTNWLEISAILLIIPSPWPPWWIPWSASLSLQRSCIKSTTTIQPEINFCIHSTLILIEHQHTKILHGHQTRPHSLSLSTPPSLLSLDRKSVV